jgi:Zn-finger nucleic acid-binding protein
VSWTPALKVYIMIFAVPEEGSAMCPACTEPLGVFELDGVEIDRCLRCAGTWLDAGEIDQLSRLHGASARGLSAAIGHADGQKPGDRRCVRCSKKMRIVTIHGVEIDRCPRGHGLWFDRSEMETLIASFREGEGAAVGHFLGEFHPPGHRKGG